MTKEEKAKRYDEAIKVAKGNYETIMQMDNDCTFAKEGIVNTFHHIFPELAESEDEKIRKEIIDFLGLPHPQFVGKRDHEKWIAWLEKKRYSEVELENEYWRGYDDAKKQGEPTDIPVDVVLDSNKDGLIADTIKYKNEQKPADKVEPIFNVGDKIQYSKGCGTIMTIEKIENGEYVFANNMGHTTIEWGNKWYLVEQKPAWSEEDASNLEFVIRQLRIITDEKHFAPIIAWLKSIKDRIQPQPKQEWSEEDEENFNTLSKIICDSQASAKIANKLSDWLEFIKNKSYI